MFSIEEIQEAQGGALPLGSVGGHDMVEAAKHGYEYRRDPAGTGWILYMKTPQPVLLVDPQALDSMEMREASRMFRLRAGLTKFPITQEKFNLFPSTYPSEGLTGIDLETRSLLQALYYVSHGVEIPAEHLTGNLVLAVGSRLQLSHALRISLQSAMLSASRSRRRPAKPKARRISCASYTSRTSTLRFAR